MRKVLTVALYPVDPPSLSFFRMTDPESFSVMPAINDALVHIDAEGAVEPALATSWTRLSSRSCDFELRRGVHFHNGEAFDADSVVATFEAHREPTPSAGSGLLLPIEHVQKLGSHRVRIETSVPDPMLLRRLFFGQIYPKGVLAREGRHHFDHHPIGTGAYRLLSYEPGKEIVLERNREHWANAATVDEIRLPFIRHNEWLERLALGEIDAAWNLDAQDCVRARRLPGIRTGSRPAALAQWFFLSNRGPLADVRVRRALNHAVHRRLLVQLAEHGIGSPQRGVASEHCDYFVAPAPYRYSPELARRLLSEAGYERGFRLRGLVSEGSTALFSAVRELLSRVGVELDADVVPRSVWMETVVVGNLTGKTYGGDFAVTSIDNPTLNGFFHHYSFLSSTGPVSIVRNPELDRMLAAAAVDTEDPTGALRGLEQFVHDEALLLYTVQQHVHAAWRDGVQVVLPRSGHFDAASFWGLGVSDAACRPPRALSVMPKQAGALQALLDGTSHTGTFYLRPDADLSDPAARRIWGNLVESELRWRTQTEPVLRELVDSLEARTNLSNVLGSTDRVTIVGYSPEGRLLFANRGYDLWFGKTRENETVFDYLGTEGPSGWNAIRATVEREGAWLGAVHLSAAGRPAGAPTRLFMTVAMARDEDGSVIGHTLVFTDFSGQEERIATAATRSILENVPYGLFVLDVHGCLRRGYSASCRQMFPGAAEGEMAGRPLVDLLGLNPRQADHFQACYQQVIDDFLPPDLSLGQLPQSQELAGRTFSLQGSLVRGERGEVDGVLFTMLDISALVAAERDAHQNRATVLVLRYRDTFESFVRELDADLAETIRAETWREDQPSVRRLLHTAKGVFGQFSLVDLAAKIHGLEDQSAIEGAALIEFRSDLWALLERERDTWRIDLEHVEPCYAVEESVVAGLEELAARAETFEELRAAMMGGLRALRERRARDLLGPITEAASQLARRRGKQVQIVVTGGDTRVPSEHRAVFGNLVHLVRNAVDHGIEEEVLRGSKPSIATITIAVARSKDTLTIAIGDDGQGIHTAAVVRRAVEMGVISPEAAARLTDTEKLHLVFEEGLSTAEAVTDISGRGVGIGAVQAAVARVGGSIGVRSVPAQGTTFEITCPVPPSRGAPVTPPRRSTTGPLATLDSLGISAALNR